MSRLIRYQGTIIQEDHVLLIKHREHATGRDYWILPGGGREPDETEEDCIKREMREETGLDVSIERLLLDDPDIQMGPYTHLKTYLCRIKSGEAHPGYEPEVEAARVYAITEVRWFDLKNSIELETELEKESVTFPLVQRIRVILGYST